MGKSATPGNTPNCTYPMPHFPELDDPPNPNGPHESCGLSFFRTPEPEWSDATLERYIGEVRSCKERSFDPEGLESLAKRASRILSERTAPIID